MKRILPTFFICLLLCSILASPVGGAEDVIISEDTTWTSDLTAADVVVAGGSTLTIQGCRVLLDSLLLEAGSKLVIEDAELVVQQRALDGDETSLEVKNSTIDMGGDLIVLINSTALLQKSFLKGGIYGYNSVMMVVNSTSEGAYIGFGAGHGSRVVVEENSVVRNASFGIYASASSVTISNTTITNNGDGIYGASQSHIEVFDSKVVANGAGMGITNSDVTLTRSFIESNTPGCGPSGCGGSVRTGIGIDLLDSNATLDAVEIRRNNVGMRAFNSNVDMYDCLLDSNSWYGLFSRESEISSNASSFTNNDWAILSRMSQISWAADPDLREHNTFSGNNYSYIQEWEVTIRTVDEEGNPIRGSQVVVETSTEEGVMPISDSTDIYGYARILVTSLHVFDNGTLEVYNHSITITKTATDAVGRWMYTHTETLAISDNVERNITLPLKYPDVKVENIVVRAKSNGTELEVVATLENIGSAAALGFTVKAVVDSPSGQITIGMVVMNLTAGETKEVVFNWGSPARGTYRITVEADSQMVLQDSDRENNIETKTYVVGGPEKFPMAQLIGGVVLIVGVFLLYKTMKKQKPDMNIKM